MKKLASVIEREQQLDAWRVRLLLTPTKTPRPLLRNALIALAEAPEWAGVLAYDEFAICTVMVRPAPWLKSHDNAWKSRRWGDHDDSLTADWLQQQEICVPTNVAAEAVETVAKNNSFHPIKDYLNGLKWDGTPRIHNLAVNYFGAEASDYHSKVSASFLVAAVARIMRPGCKVDHIPILEGEQDIGKSSAIEELFAPWFSDDLAELGTKDAAMQARVAWGIEIAELASMGRAEIEKIKAFITRKVDRFRPSYGRRVIEVPRQSVFVGSTNADAYLKDETGGRRFWPIRCGKINLAAIRRDRDQLWAEAVAEYKRGSTWWLDDDRTAAQAREEQTERYVEDPWQSKIETFVEDRNDISIAEILADCLYVEVASQGQTEQNRVARCLRVMGWERFRTARPLRAWRYRRDGR